MSKAAMKLALEALEANVIGTSGRMPKTHEAITALREALAEQPAQQEPVAWPCLIAEADFSEDTVTLKMQCTDYKVSAGKHWLSNTPPAQRKPLTDEQREEIAKKWRGRNWTVGDIIDAIEAAHGIKE